MDKVSLLLYFGTMISVLIILVILLLSKSGNVRKAMILFFICLDWSLFGRVLILDDNFIPIPVRWIILPLFISSIILIIALTNEILNSIKKRKQNERLNEAQ